MRRLLTAALAIPLLIALLFAAPDIVWIGFCALALGVASFELVCLTHVEDRVGRFVGVLFGQLSFFLFIVTQFGAVQGVRLGVGLVGLVMVSLLFTLTKPEQVTKAFLRLSGHLLSVFYLGAMMAALVLVRGFGTPRQGGLLTILVLSFAWLSDAFAMAAGKFFGGPKLFPAISPNKTWTGAFGGLVGALLSVILIQGVFLPELPFWRGMVLAFFAGTLGQLGDLCESALKRAVNIKDSGTLLPGHGGLLDRLDAVFFTAVTVYGFLAFGWLPFPSR